MTQPKLKRRDFLKLLGAAAISASARPLFSQTVGSSPTLAAFPNILILVFDALSARDMSLYGYPRQTTPNIEKFSRQATVYHQHYSPGSFTTPGTASLLTGVFPWKHRAINLQGTVHPSFVDHNLFRLLPPDYHSFAYTHNSLAYILLDQFSHSVGKLLEISDLAVYSDIWAEKIPLEEFHVPLEAEILASKNSFSIDGSLFLSLLDEAQRYVQSERVLQKYRKTFPRGIPNCRPEDPDNAVCFTLEDAFDWIIRQFQSASQPFLGYVHVYPPHAPYNPRKEFIGIFQDTLDAPSKPEHHFSAGENNQALIRQRRRYDEYIAYADAEFGRLLEQLSKNPAFENTCLIVTSDHGEIFERGVSGHNTEILYEPLLHIPLIIAYPGQKSRVDIHSPTSSVDLVPTLLKLTGKDPLPSLDGISLPTEKQTPPAAREIFAMDAKSSPSHGKLRRATFALQVEGYKLISYRGYRDFDGKYELYELKSDPEELEDLSAKHAETAREMLGMLNQTLQPYL